MESVSKWLLTDAEKDKFIATLTPNLPALRTQAEISQEELANLIGISRQTYSSIERKVRRMAWSTYLSLVLFFDHNQKTHKMLRRSGIKCTLSQAGTADSIRQNQRCRPYRCFRDVYSMPGMQICTSEW